MRKCKCAMHPSKCVSPFSPHKEFVDAQGPIPKLAEHVKRTNANHFRNNLYILFNCTFVLSLRDVFSQHCFWLISFLSAVVLTQSWEALLFYLPAKHCSELSSISNNRIVHTSDINVMKSGIQLQRSPPGKAEWMLGVELFQYYLMTVNTLVTSCYYGSTLVVRVK